MAKNVFVRATVLHNVKGRIKYATSPDKQEHLMAYADNMPKGGWAELAQFSRQRAALYHPGQKVCEARELIYQLPNAFSEEEALRLAINLRDDFSNRYGVPCAVAIHWNKAENNYHAHLIFAERGIRREAHGESVATRNTYFNEQGKRSTKKECLDEHGELKPGCRLVKKGELLSEGSRFSAKKNCFAQAEWLDNEKKRMALFFNKKLGKDEWKVYNWKTDPHFSFIRIKTGEPAGLTAWKNRENEWRKLYNETIDELMKRDEISFEQALNLKFQEHEKRQRLRRERAENKKLWVENWQHYKARMYAEREYFNRLRNKSLLGLVVELALAVAGVDVVKKCSGVEQSDFVTQRYIKAYRDPKIQKMIDDMYIAAGKEPPTVLTAKSRLERLRKDYENAQTLEEKLAISMKIAEVEDRLKEKTRSQPIRDFGLE